MGKTATAVTTAMPLKEEPKKVFKTVDDVCRQYANFTNRYIYLNADGEPSILQVRCDNKDGSKFFNTYHKVDKGWEPGKPHGLSPLYNIENITSSKVAIVVEGEKVVDMLTLLGIPATTSIGGSNCAHLSDWSPLANKDSIAIWRDNDDPGLKYQQIVAKQLNEMGKEFKIVSVENLGLEKGDDLVDFVDKLKLEDADKIKKEIYAVLNNDAKKVGGFGEPLFILKDHLEKVRSGKIKNIQMPFFPLISDTVRMFKPGSQGVIYSQGGIGKSLIIGRTCDEWNLQGIARAKRLMLESTMDFHLLRTLAQQSGDTRVLLEEFHYDNPDESISIVNEYEDVLTTIGESITTSDTGSRRSVGEWGVDTVLKWIKDNAPHNDVLIIDPISIIVGGHKSVWVASNLLTAGAEEIMIEHPHLSIIWVHHPSDDGVIAGGKAWGRYTSAILEIVMLDEPERYEVRLHDGSMEPRYVKTFFHVKKCRNGSAMTHKIAIDLDQNSLTYKEVGRMLRKIKE